MTSAHAPGTAKQPPRRWPRRWIPAASWSLPRLRYEQRTGSDRCLEGAQRAWCPLWVKSRHLALQSPC